MHYYLREGAIEVGGKYLHVNSNRIRVGDWEEAAHWV